MAFGLSRTLSGDNRKELPHAAAKATEAAASEATEAATATPSRIPGTLTRLEAGQIPYGTLTFGYRVA